MGILLAVIAITIQSGVGIDGIESQYNALKSAKEWDPSKYRPLTQGVLGLASNDELKTGSDYRRASKVISDFNFRFQLSRVKHELCLVALAAGDEEARNLVASTWDALLVSTGRPQRIGSIKVPGNDRFLIVEAPSSIRAVFLHPQAAADRARGRANCSEATKLCADDQAVRNQDWSKLTAKQMMQIGVADTARKKRMIALLKRGSIVTTDDFDHASLVLQHGESWEDYCLAHELSICSLLLGQKEAAWLTAASYDRLLNSGGYLQRFGTQYFGEGHEQPSLQQVDTEGIGDQERKLMHCPSLAEAKARKWE